MADISAFLAEIREQFIADLPARLDTMESQLLELQRDRDFDAVFDDVYRTVHSLKGSAGTHGLHIISTIAHHLENELTRAGAQFKNDIPVQHDQLLQYIDLLRQALERINNNSSDFADIESQLEKQYFANGTKASRVLLLESSQLFTSMIKESLSAYPIHLETRDNGYIALQRLLLEPFNIVITHIEAPMLNGIALIVALRLSDTGKNIKSILLTANPHHPCHRNVDPDYIIVKDADFIDRFTSVISTALSDINA